MANLSPTPAPPPRPGPPPPPPPTSPAPGRFRPGDSPPFRMPVPPDETPSGHHSRHPKRVYRVGSTLAGHAQLTTEQLEEAIAKARELMQEAEANAVAAGQTTPMPTTVTITQTHDPQPVS